MMEYYEVIIKGSNWYVGYMITLESKTLEHLDWSEYENMRMDFD